tara:strand:- start:1457 stop:2155 length:699 start_codon:yes stop_codon:yes gene_type:complete
MNLSIIIPCYNEEKTIIQILKKIHKNVNFDYEIIIIDDFSNDKTHEILLQNKDLYNTLIKNDKNYGKGFSLRKGFKIANGDLILIQDADLEYDPIDYKNLLKPLLDGNADVVYGSRFWGGGSRKIHFFWHTMANKILTLFCNIRTNLNLTDMECGYKVFKKEKLEEINLEENSFGFEPEITIKLAKKNISFYEVGVNYYGRSYKEGKKISFKDAVRAFYIIFFCYIGNDKKK